MKTFIGEAQLGLQRLLEGRLANGDAEKVSRMIQDATRAQHFYLPDNGNLVGDLDHKYSMKGLPVRLPFRTITASVALVAEHNNIKMVVVAKESVATLNNGKPLSNVIECRSAISVNRSTWIPNPIVGLIDMDACFRGDENACELRPFLADIGSEIEDMIDDVAGHALAAASVIFNLLAALSCENVSFSSEGFSNPEKAIKRLAKNKEPVYATKVLKIETPVKKVIGLETVKNVSDSTGHRLGPKQHLRRGHIRTLPSGRRIWVNECLVGDEVNGVVDKRYLVGA